jgi:hypothetical protein
MGAYILWFGALWGDTTFGHALFYQWILMAVVGSILVGIKNLKISNPQRRLKVTVADLLMIATLLVLINVLPTSIGLVRSAIVLLVVAIYILIYFNLLYKGKLVEQGANTLS